MAKAKEVSLIDETITTYKFYKLDGQKRKLVGWVDKCKGRTKTVAIELMDEALRDNIKGGVHVC